MNPAFKFLPGSQDRIRKGSLCIAEASLEGATVDKAFARTKITDELPVKRFGRFRKRSMNHFSYGGSCHRNRTGESEWLREQWKQWINADALSRKGVVQGNVN